MYSEELNITYLSSLLSNLLAVLANILDSFLSRGELNIQISTLLLTELNPGWRIGNEGCLIKRGGPRLLEQLFLWSLLMPCIFFWLPRSIWNGINKLIRNFIEERSDGEGGLYLVNWESVSCLTELEVLEFGILELRMLFFWVSMLGIFSMLLIRCGWRFMAISTFVITICLQLQFLLILLACGGLLLKLLLSYEKASFIS